MTDTTPEAVERLIDRIHESKAGRDVRTDAIETLMRERDDARDKQDALIAAAYDTAAHEVRGSNLGLDINDIADDVRALTPADATAALDRIKRQARAEGMRRAATICNRSYGDGLGAAHKAILAAAKQEERGDDC